MVHFFVPRGEGEEKRIGLEAWRPDVDAAPTAAVIKGIHRLSVENLANFIRNRRSVKTVPLRKPSTEIIMKIAISEMKGAAFLFLVLTCLSLYVKSVSCAAYIGRSPGYYDAAIEGQNPEYVLQTLARIRQELLREDLENTKRGLDLGLGRGFSGTQQAKHLMGLAAAQFAGGPGRRRRSNDDDENQN